MYGRATQALSGFARVMQVARWLLLVPAVLMAGYGLRAATIAVHYLAKQHLCPARDLVMGISNNVSLGWALSAFKHVAVGLSIPSSRACANPTCQ